MNLNNGFIRLSFKFFRYLFFFLPWQGGCPALACGSNSKNLLGKSLKPLSDKPIIQVMRRKRPFVLLEVLIALALVALCAIPLVVQPIRAYRCEIKSLEEGEIERLADLAFSEIKARLLNNEISWGQIPKRGETTSFFPLESTYIQLPGCNMKRIHRDFSLFCKGEKRGMGGESYRMLHVKVRLRPGSYQKTKNYEYSYRTIVRLYRT